MSKVAPTGVVVDGVFHYIANSQLEARSNDGTIASVDALREVLILNLPVEAG